MGAIPRLDLSGRKFGKLTAVERVGNNRHSQSMWRCSCECGGEKIICISSLTQGDTGSCGCLRSEAWQSRSNKNIKNETFRCVKCKLRKPLLEKAGGRGCYRCVPCNRDFGNKWYREHPDSCKRSRENYRAKNRNEMNRKSDQKRRDNPAKHLHGVAKLRAARLKVPFTIRVEDVAIPDLCPVLGIPLVFRASGTKGFPLAQSPSIDRMDPSAGYVPGNVSVISWRANSLKKDGTLAEFEKLVAWMRDNQRPPPASPSHEE